MKRFFSYLMVMATLVLVGGKAMAQSVTIDGVVYSVNGDHAYVSGNDGTVTDVVVLGTVTINDVEYPVTEIGQQAFYNHQTLISVSLPEGITSISEDAFYGCTSLPIENGVRYADSYAIEVTDKTLTKYTLKENIRFLGSELFRDCSAMTSVNIPLGVTAINNNTFYGCVALDSIVLPETVTTIGDYAFYNCSSLTSINIPLGVISIGNYAFSNCSSLSSLTLPETVTSIGPRAFNMCSSLDSINIPFGVPLIDEWTFCGCSSLTSLILPETVTSIKHRAFYACAKLNTIILPKKLTNIESYAFEDCKKLRRIMNFSDLQLTIGYIDNGYVAAYAQQIINVDTIIDNFWFDTDSNGRHHLTYYEGTDSILTLPADYQGGNYSIDGSAFSGHNEIVSIHLPEAVDSIGASAFYGCSSLASVNIPLGVTVIADNTFYGCSALTSLILPETVASIGAQAFYNCSSLASVNIPSGVTSISYSTFCNCFALTSMTIPASVTSIGNHAFDGCTELRELNIADGNNTLSLGDNGYKKGFFASDKLEKLFLGRNLNYSTGNASSPFYNITSLREVIVGDCVTDIGVNLFYNCSSLASIHLSENITSIGDHAFQNCSSLTSVILPVSLESIGTEAFRYCSSLTSVTFPDDLTLINWAAFADCPIRTVVSQEMSSPNILGGNGPVVSDWVVIYAPEGTYSIYKECFPNNIVIDGEPNNVTVNITIPGTLGEEVLNQVGYIREVNTLTINGTLNSDDITCINSSMVNLLHLDLAKANLTEVSGVGHKKLLSIVLPDSCKKVSGYGDYDNFISLTLPNAVEELGPSCFSNCDNLSEVRMPAKLRTVGSYAFSSCRKLMSIAFNDSLKYVGNNAFEHCDNLKSVFFNEGLTIVDYNTFWQTWNIAEIHISSIKSWLGIQFVDSWSRPNENSSVNLYLGDGLVTNVEVPSSMTSIPESAFRNMKKIISVSIPEEITSIGAYAFSGCDDLASVSIAEGVKIIGANAFASCDSLKTITLPSTLNNCAAGAFSGSGLTEVTCPAFFPPITGGDLIGANNCTLYVPEWTLNRYKLANNWNLFASIEPISGIYPNSISVYTEESLTIPAEGLAADYKPNMEIVRYDNSNIGRFTVRGEGTLPLSSFKMQQTRDANTMTSLVNYGTLTADNVVTDLNISTNTWHFLTFPYDVKVSDIATVGNWVISRYDGAARAKEDFGNTWKTLPYDSILHAGEGYIWHSQGGNFTVPAVDNENKNLIFANDTRYVQLKENPAATEANYGWNLIGNPYPCYYDTRYMQFSSPITVRSGDSYAAYSPVDDSYILSPLEAFFVQCSAENNIVSFDTEGRQTDNSVRTLSYAPARTRAMGNERSVLNLYLESNAYADHTRLVVNEGASLAYEIACDAAKFMSDDATVPQLFTIEGGERMAINERPLANGKAALGIYIGKAGNYTLSLDTKAMDTEVFLVDKLQGTETDLTTGSYVFTTEAGTFTDRFEIRMKRTGVVDGIEAVAAELKVEATADGISVSNATTPIYIYNATGALIDIKTGNAVTFDVPQGVYVVKVGDNVHKVVVK